MALDFFAGCIGGVAGVLVGHPLDTVKVRLQTQDYKNPIYRGTWHTFSTIVKQETVWGLYRGVTSPMGGVAVINAIVFGVYGNCQRAMARGPNDLRSHFVAGAVAGGLQSFVCSPMELAKTRLQIQKNNTYKSSIDCLVKTFKEGGIRGFYKGFYITCVREIPSFGTYFLVYEGLMMHGSGSTLRMLVAGGTAGCVSWLIAYPIDVIKTRIQSDGIEGRPFKYRHSLHCLRLGLAEEGTPFLTRGIMSTMIRAFPVNAVTFSVVTWVFELYGQLEPELTPEMETELENIASEVLHSHEESLYPKDQSSSWNSLHSDQDQTQARPTVLKEIPGPSTCIKIGLPKK